MVLRSGIIIPFQYRDAKKLLMIGVPEENRDLSIFDLKNVVRAAFGIYNFEFRNKKIGFNIPDELLLLYLAQRHDLTNFVVEVGQASDESVAVVSASKDPLCFEPSSSSSQKRKHVPQVVIDSNENSDDQSSNLEAPANKIRILQVFSEPPPSESYSHSADESIEIEPKTEIQEDFVESDPDFQYMPGLINSSRAKEKRLNGPTLAAEQNNRKEFLKLSKELSELNELKKVIRDWKGTIPANHTTTAIKSPFKTANEFVEFESRLQQDSSLFDQLVSDFCALPVRKTQNFLKLCWRSVMIDSVAEQFSWRGTDTKRSIRNLSTTLALKIGEQHLNDQQQKPWHTLEPAAQAIQAIQSDSVGYDFPTWGMIANFSNKEELQRLLEDKHKIIFENFKSQLKLTNNERVKISKTIVQHLLADPNRTLSSKDLLNISELICQVFIGELPTTYYVKFSQGRHASGKMYDAYNNYRSSLAASGLIQRRQRILKTIVKTNAQLEMEQARRTQEQLAEEKAALQLLGIEHNFEESIELWKKTFFHRQDEIVKAQMSAFDYIKKYPILKKPDGFKLYITDVERKFKTNLTLNIRDDFCRNMIERTKLVRLDCVSKITQLIRKEPKDANKQVLALMLLPYLFPVSLKRGNQGISKPTKEESAQTFICHFPDMSTAEAGIQSIIAKSTIDNNVQAQMQPLIVFVGHSEIERTFVVVGDVRYALKNIHDAITCAISAYLALNLKYPTGSEKAWFFVQKYICNISTALDSTLENKVKTFAKDLNFISK